jgi:hypothetical protein
MIADGPPPAGPLLRYRGDVRNPVRTSWLLFFAFLIGSGILLRLVRSPWLAAIVIVAFVLAWLALTIVARTRSPSEPPRPAVKDVTPIEPKLPAGAISPPDPAGVVIVGPETPMDDLTARLEALERLRARGLVTDAEYEAKRAQLIADF